ISDDDAIRAALDPRMNPYRLSTLNVSAHSPLSRAAHHAFYTFPKKLSHTADSQDQRHRMVPASRPLLTLTDTEAPDAVTPDLIAANPKARAAFDEAVGGLWEAKRRLLALGVEPQHALYLLPNAKAVRMEESGSLHYLLHKWTMRLCFNAQREIYDHSIEEFEQVAEVHPRFAPYIGPPCHLRKDLVQPYCTEGAHYCGVKVWKTFPKAERRL
ncbi:MAG: FAD-dependent thymidylate synthase, partial [Candidatus Methylomirabilis sp.]|nr:FAD-dependent thymidylate synthase [Deltaproteobacteria bacterium]